MKNLFAALLSVLILSTGVNAFADSDELQACIDQFDSLPGEPTPIYSEGSNYHVEGYTKTGDGMTCYVSRNRTTCSCQ